MTAELNKRLTLVSRNPATEEIIAETSCTPLEEIPSIVERARQASLSWRQKPLSERLAVVAVFHDLLLQGCDSLSKLISTEAGKPFNESMVSEVFSVLETCRWLERKAPEILRDRAVDLNPVFFAGKRSFNSFAALGVIAVVSPWNYPFAIPAASLLMAATAGNGAVLKPSPKTPLIAAALVELMERAGFPRGLIGLVQGNSLECERLILSGVNRVIFTGGVEGGKAIMRIASEKLVPVTLELGGKHPALVLPDADPEPCSSGLVWSAFTNAGQACASVDRVYLVKKEPSALVDKIVEKCSKLRLGNGMDSRTDIGPLIDEQQLERVDELVRDAKEKGGRVLCGGRARRDLGGYFYEPTVLVDLKENMKLMREEIFGPLLPLVFVDSVEEAVARANNSVFGLAASVWTSDLKTGERLAREIEAGVVWLNDGLYSHVCPDVPWGGLKQSGFGRAHSESELLDMVSVKNISVSAQGDRDWYYPYSESARGFVRAGIDLIHKSGIGGKIGALKRLLSCRADLHK